MASPAPLHNLEHHRHPHPHPRPSIFPAISPRPCCCCCCCCCCCVRRILLHHQQHHHIHHQLFHAQGPPPWTPHGFRPFLVPCPGVFPSPNLSHGGGQCGATGQDAVGAGGTLGTSEDVSSNRLQEGTREENFEGVEEVGEGGEQEEEEEAVYVLTDEWAEFFAKSEAKRQLERKRKKQLEKRNM